MSSADVKRRPGGRSARVRDAVLTAALELVSAEGADALTIAAVASRAGVHETSIYRRWGTRETLLVDALLSNSEQQLPIPDTGSLRQDLIAFATSLGAFMHDSFGRALTRALASIDDGSQETRDRFWEGRYAAASAMISRAVERGELAAAVDAQLALEALVGPVHFRALMTNQPIDGPFIEALVELLLSGLLTTAPAGP